MMVHYNNFTLFFWLMTRSPPTSTLFPYTTLFRSLRARERPDGNRSSTAPVWRRRSAPRGARRGCGLPAGRDGEDRKSTRLNSSHSQISYAVFCLKKKKPYLDHIRLRLLT